jgi:hypothetical protein
MRLYWESTERRTEGRHLGHCNTAMHAESFEGHDGSSSLCMSSCAVPSRARVTTMRQRPRQGIQSAACVVALLNDPFLLRPNSFKRRRESRFSRRLSRYCSKIALPLLRFSLISKLHLKVKKPQLTLFNSLKRSFFRRSTHQEKRPAKIRHQKSHSPSLLPQQPPSMCIYGTIPDPVAPGVWFRDDYEWVLYNAPSAKMITDAYVDAEKTLDLTIKSGVHPSGARYKVDLRIMQQTNVSSGMVRPVKIVMPETTAVIKAVKTVPMANGIQVCFIYASWERVVLNSCCDKASFCGSITKLCGTEWELGLTCFRTIFQRC